MNVGVRQAEGFGLKLHDVFISLEPRTVVVIVIVISLIWFARHLLAN